MKKGFLVGLVLSAAASSLWADAMEDGIIVNNYDWSGAYIGANLGGIWSQFNGYVTTSSFPAGVFINPASRQLYNANRTSFLGGGQLGYNWQRNNIVFGTEISADGMNLNRSHTLTFSEVQFPYNVYTAGDVFSSQINWQADWVARIGMATPTRLLYAVAGLALTQASVTTNIIALQRNGINFPASSGSASKVLLGGTVGAGVEYAIYQNFKLGLEYRYTGYGSQNYSNGTQAVYATTPTTFVYAPIVANMNLTTNQLVLRLDYQFDIV